MTGERLFFHFRVLMSSIIEGDYFDLSLVPEQFTGYSGPSAHNLWRSIYEENCFGLSEFNLMSGKSTAPATLPDTMTDILREDTENGDHCLEKRVYYKVVSGNFTPFVQSSFLADYSISGLHASISTHICHEYLDQTTGEWVEATFSH